MKSLLYTLPFLFLFSACASKAPNPAKSPKEEQTAVSSSQNSRPAQPATNVRPLTRAQLQSEMMNFVDTYIGTIGEAADNLVASCNTPEQRVAAQGAKVYPTYWLISMAAAPQPEDTLLDMLVLTKLERLNYEEPWAEEMFGERLKPMQLAQREMEDRAWRLGARVLNENQRKELRRVILEWNQANPDRQYVSSTRFDDFQQSSNMPAAITSIVSTIQFFNPVTQVSSAASTFDRVIEFGERTNYFLQRMPILISWQSELLLYELAAQPESVKTLERMERLTVTAEEMGDFVETLPDEIAREREIVLEEVTSLIERERKALLADFEKQSEALRQIATDTRTSLESLERTIPEVSALLKDSETTMKESEQTMKESEQTIAALQELMLNFDRIFGISKEKVHNPNSHPFDIRDYTETAIEARATFEELKTVLEEANTALESESITNVVNQVDRQASILIDRAFYRALVLIVLFWLIAILSLLAYQLVRRRIK